MKILLIQSCSSPEKMSPIFPLGLAYLAGCLRKYEVKALDLNTQTKPFLSMENVLTGFNPDVVGISLRNIDNVCRTSMLDFYTEFKTVVQHIRKTSPRATLIVGGAGFSMHSRDIMVQNHELDFGVFLEAEETLPELIENLNNPQEVKGIFHRDNDDVVFTGPRKLAEVKHFLTPRRDIFDLSKYTNELVCGGSFSVGVQSKRGCPLRCTYCNYPFLSGKKHRLRSPVEVVDEIQELKEKYKRDSFSFVDTIFNAPRQHAEEICKEIIRRKLQVRWSAYFQFQNIDEGFLVLCKSAGAVSFEFSPDGLSKGALKGLNKGISKADIDKVVDSIQIKELKDTEVVFNFYINPPGETFLGLLQTLFYLRKISKALKGRGAVYAGWIRILPNTDVHKVAIEKGIIDPEMSLLQNDYDELEKKFYSNPPLNHLDVLLKPYVHHRYN